MPTQHSYGGFAARVYLAFRYPILAFFLIMLVGTVGYWYISDGKASLVDCVYMTFITIATIGYREIVNLEGSPAGRVFTMVVSGLGIANFAYVAARLTAFIVEEEGTTSAAAEPMKHPYREFAARVYLAFRYPIFAFFLIMLLGTVGYWHISGYKATLLDCAYMTFITIATIGYGEIVDLAASPGGRVFTMVIAFLGIANFTYMVSKMTAFIVENDLNEGLRRHRMQRQIAALSGHYIVCGIGRVGTNILRELETTGRRCVVIEPAQPALEAMREDFPRQPYLHGDGADDEMLLAAGVKRAAGVFAVSGDDHKNLVITLSAKQLNARARVVARCHDVRFVDKIRRVGADDIVSPDFTGALRIASSMLRPAVVSFLDEMLRTDKGLRVEEIVLPTTAKERALGELAPADTNYIVLALRYDGRWEFNPPADRQARPGSTLVVMTTPEGRAKLECLVAT